jgi:hypothetical protein
MRRRLIWASVLAVMALGAPAAALAQDNEPLGDLPLNPEWLSNTLERAAAVGEVKNNTVDGAIERRDAAAKAYKDALAAGENPSPFSKPEYTVMWSAKQNVADVNADVLSKFIQNLTINPQGLADLANPQFLPGLDGWQVIDERKLNVDGSKNPDYGRVVNFVQLPLPWGVETEAHHMQYQWNDGDPIIAGALFTDVTFVVDPTDIPNLTLKNIIPPQETLLGTIPDAYDAVGDGRFIGTYMGGPEANFGGSPGSVVTFKPDAEKGLVLESETPAGNIGGIGAGNANGVPEPCSVREGRPLGTCANPHGIEIRQDITTMLTSDYAEPREIVLDPIKNIDKYAFRPTVRTWDTSDPAKPVLKSVSHVPGGPFNTAQRAHQNYGMMEAAKTWPNGSKYKGGLDSKGMFTGSMCGGGIFFTPDVSSLKGDASKEWVQVWNDGLSIASMNDLSNGEFSEEPSGCAGGAWHQVTPSNTLLFRSVQGRNPGSDNYFDSGLSKLVYNVNIKPLIKSAQDGHVACDLSRGIHEDGIELTGIQLAHELAEGHKVADCPRLNSTLKVNDPTTGGPHWAALDNHSLDQRGIPYRLMFSNYFVSRTGVDGDHRAYTVDITARGKLKYDKSFRDENTGAIGINFNRRNWPGSPDAGFYKPHSMVWVCPPGICPDEPTIYPRKLGGATDRSLVKKKKRPRLSLRVKPNRDTKAAFQYPAKGKLKLPKGVSKKVGCTGDVLVRITRGNKLITKQRLALSKRCKYSTKLNASARLSKFGSGKMRVRARFLGNAVLLKAKSPWRRARYGPVFYK